MALASLFTFYYACKTFYFYLTECMHDHFDELREGSADQIPNGGTGEGSSRCCFMAAFVPHAACLALRVGNGAIMHCIACMHMFSRARGASERPSLGEVSCMHACLHLVHARARALLGGLGLSVVL